MPDRAYHETDLAYAAGIIDGEGSIMLRRTRIAARGSVYPAWYARVCVDMTDSHVPLWLHDTFGGVMRAIPTKTANRERLVWMLTRLEARNFLELIRPYLKQKGRQADLLAAFYSDPGISFAPRGGIRLSVEEVSLRDSYTVRMSRLNGRERPVHA